MISDQFDVERKTAIDMINSLRDMGNIKLESSRKKGYKNKFRILNDINKIKWKQFCIFGYRLWTIDQMDLDKMIDECFSQPMINKKSRSKSSNSSLDGSLSVADESKTLVKSYKRWITL